MAKYHINKHGVPAPCKARPGNCPYGGDDQHFASRQEAQDFIDNKNEKDHGLLPGIDKNKSLPYKKAKTKKDFQYIKNQKEFLKNESPDMTYIERCRSCKRIDDYVPVNQDTFHYSEHRQRRTQGLLKEFGEGNLIGYYKVDHLLGKSRHYKKQIVELRDNGIIKVYDIKDGRTVTTFIPHRARIEAMMILSDEIPDNTFLQKAIRNKSKAKRLGYDS